MCRFIIINMDRKTFFINNKPVRAAGVLFYRQVPASVPLDRIEVLVQTNHTTDQGYEDLGGKVDHDDLDVIDTAAREVSEETNAIISRDCVRNQILYSNVPPIISSRKYALFVLFANSYERRLTGDDFSNYESNNENHFPRSVEWVSLSTLLKSKYHVRLADIMDQILKALI